jgi:hypothetical protein
MIRSTIVSPYVSRLGHVNLAGESKKAWGFVEDWRATVCAM